MRLLLSSLVIFLATLALFILWRPYKSAQASSFHRKPVIVLDDEPPKRLGTPVIQPGRTDKESRPKPAGDRGSRTEASWYDTRPTYCYKPGRTRVPPTELWVAHKTLPCGTLVEVSGPKGTLVLPVYDRGPYIPGRELDLSAKAFQVIVGPLSQGVGTVNWRVLG